MRRSAWLIIYIITLKTALSIYYMVALQLIMKYTGKMPAKKKALTVVLLMPFSEYKQGLLVILVVRIRYAGYAITGVTVFINIRLIVDIVRRYIIFFAV